LLALLLGFSSFQRLEPSAEVVAAACRVEDAVALMKIDSFSAAIPLLNESIAAFEKAGDWKKWIEACFHLDRCFWDLYLPEEGIEFALGALSKIKGLKNEQKLRAEILLILGDNYMLQNNYSKALPVYEEGLALAEQFEDTFLLSSFYINLGRICWETGNHTKGLDFQLKAHHFILIRKDTANLPIVLSWIGDSYRSKSDLRAFDYFRESVAINPDDLQTWIQFSKAYQAFGKLDSAFVVLKQALPLLEDDAGKADYYYQCAQLYLEKRDFPKALFNIQKALKLGLEGYGPDNAEFARMNTLAGKIYLASGNTEKALTWFHQNLLRQSDEVAADLDLTQSPTLEQLAPNSYWVLGSLNGKGAAYYQKYKKTNQKENLNHALAAYELALNYGENMRLSYGHESSKTDLYEYLSPAVAGGIKAAMAMASETGESVWHEKAFAFAERIKAAVMAEALHDKSIKHLANIPDSVLEKERLWEDSVVVLEMLADQEPDVEVHRTALTDARLALNRVKKDMETAFPRYYELKYGFKKDADVRQIQENLDEGALLVEYFKGDSTLYAFALSKTGMKAYATPITAVFDSTLNQFRRSVSDWDYLAKDESAAERDFLAAAPKLYEWLLAKPLSEFRASRLIIVPDGALGLIPFDALLTAPYAGDWTDLDMPYLLKTCPLSYAWSAGAIRPRKEAGSGTANNFGGFGTRFETENADSSGPIAMRRALGPLPYAAEEVKNAGKLLRGKTWIDAEATKANFLAHAPECGILHIAAHGILNEENPMQSYLAFDKTNPDAENRLFASELYTLELRAQLAVLSACNTGSGKIAAGEGNMSVARAIAYAGCPTLVSNLWSADDRASAKLSQLFYEALKTGATIDEALHRAKLAYFKASESANAIPAYWANLVVIGQCDALFEPPTPWWKIAAGLLIGAVLVYFLYWWFMRFREGNMGF